MDEKISGSNGAWSAWQWVAVCLVAAGIVGGLFYYFVLAKNSSYVAPVTLYTPPDSMEKWNWILSDISPQGLQFTYPNPLPTKYVTTPSWPPLVEMTVGAFTCAEGDIVAPDGMRKHLARRVIDDHIYCVTTDSEGAAGSTYTNYAYTTEQGAFVTRVAFTLRTPQCLNYNEPERGACKAEQAGFNVDALAHRIASTTRTR